MFLGSLLIKGSESQNLLIAGSCGKIRMAVAPGLKRLLKINDKLSKIDSISDYSLFEKEAGFLVHPKKSLHQVFFGTESYRYGYYNEFLNYAGMKNWFIPVFSAMEHGVRFSGAEWIYDNNNTAFACEGNLRISEVRNKNAYMPIFVLGTYMHYVRPYYTEKQTAELKKKLGKTLLIFLSHSCDTNLSRIDDNNIIDMVYNNYATDFDTVMVCVYWNDIKDEQVYEFRKRGALLVSAGYRADKNFVRRLRTIIELSDYCIGNDIGTNMGFSRYLNKDFALVASDNRLPNDPYYTKNYDDFLRAYTPTDGKYGFSKEQKDMQQRLYEDFWGGDRFIRTKDEAYAMLKVMKRVCRMANYEIDKIPAAIEKYLRKQPGNDKNELCRKMLLESLGRNN